MDTEKLLHVLVESVASLHHEVAALRKQVSEFHNAYAQMEHEEHPHTDEEVHPQTILLDDHLESVRTQWLQQLEAHSSGKTVCFEDSTFTKLNASRLGFGNDFMKRVLTTVQELFPDPAIHKGALEKLRKRIHRSVSGFPRHKAHAAPPSDPTDVQDRLTTPSSPACAVYVDDSLVETSVSVLGREGIVIRGPLGTISLPGGAVMCTVGPTPIVGVDILTINHKKIGSLQEVARCLQERFGAHGLFEDCTSVEQLSADIEKAVMMVTQSKRRRMGGGHRRV